MKPAMSRRAALAGLAAIATAGGTPALPAIGAEPDPIFPLIETHKAAVAAYNALFDGKTEESMTEEEWFATTTEHMDDMGYALEDVVSTMPTTPYGLACVLRHLGSRPSCYP